MLHVARHSLEDLVDQHMNFITVGVSDVAASRQFYVDGLGWTPTFELEGEVCFLQVASGVLLALWGAKSLADDVGVDPADPSHGVGRFSLAHNLGSEAEVDDVVARFEAAGGSVLKAPQKTFFGYHAYVADPDGFRWEIAHNPGWSVDADGTVHLGPE